MDYLIEKKEQLNKALASWQKALKEDKSDISRDASIQRFEYSVELLWKTVKQYLAEQEGIVCNSPKSCFRELRGVLDNSAEDIETCLRMVGDRSFSVHTYSEELADALYNKLQNYYKVARNIANLI